MIDMYSAFRIAETWRDEAIRAERSHRMLLERDPEAHAVVHGTARPSRVASMTAFLRPLTLTGRQAI